VHKRARHFLARRLVYSAHGLMADRLDILTNSLQRGNWPRNEKARYPHMSTTMVVWLFWLYLNGWSCKPPQYVTSHLGHSASSSHQKMRNTDSEWRCMKCDIFRIQARCLIHLYR